MGLLSHLIIILVVLLILFCTISAIGFLFNSLCFELSGLLFSLIVILRASQIWSLRIQKAFSPSFSLTRPFSFTLPASQFHLLSLRTLYFDSEALSIAGVNISRLLLSSNSLGSIA